MSSPHLRGELARTLCGLRAVTAEAYASDVAGWLAWVGVRGDRAWRYAMAIGSGAAEASLRRYCDDLRRQGRTDATIARTVAAVRAAYREARALGLSDVVITYAAPRARAHVGRVVSRAQVERVLETADTQPDRVLAARDVLGIRLSWDLGLRVAELVALDRADVRQVELGHVRATVTRKGGAVVDMRLPAPTVAALAAWLDVRGDAPGPLLGARGRSLSARGWRVRVARLGREAGIGHLHPHQIRAAMLTHASLTIDAFTLQEIAGHSSVRSTAHYVRIGQDRAHDGATRVARELRPSAADCTLALPFPAPHAAAPTIIEAEATCEP